MTLFDGKTSPWEHNTLTLVLIPGLCSAAGDISVESQENVGTTVRLTIKARLADRKEIEARKNEGKLERGELANEWPLMDNTANHRRKIRPIQDLTYESQEAVIASNSCGEQDFESKALHEEATWRDIRKRSKEKRRRKQAAEFFDEQALPQEEQHRRSRIGQLDPARPISSEDETSALKLTDSEGDDEGEGQPSAGLRVLIADDNKYVVVSLTLLPLPHHRGPDHAALPAASTPSSCNESWRSLSTIMSPWPTASK